MTLHVPAPRLLPLTIATLAALLAAKTVDLARFAMLSRHDSVSAMVAEARAAVADRSSAAPEPGTPAPGTQPNSIATPSIARTQSSATAAPAAAPSPAAPSTDSTGPPITDSERAILLELRQRRQQLDARDAALTARESILAAAEQKLEAQTEALAALQKKLQDLEDARQQREETGWQGLVKLYENMKPRDAATIFNDLDMPVLLSLLDRMKELKAAPILAAMSPDKARDVTAGLARMRTRREATGAAHPGG